MHATRVRLRRLLSALIAEREDSQLLYIPHGEPGMRRMIAALLALPLATVLSKYHRALKKMRAYLEGDDAR